MHRNSILLVSWRACFLTSGAQMHLLRNIYGNDMHSQSDIVWVYGTGDSRALKVNWYMYIAKEVHWDVVYYHSIPDINNMQSYSHIGLIGWWIWKMNVTVMSRSWFEVSSTQNKRWLKEDKHYASRKLISISNYWNHNHVLIKRYENFIMPKHIFGDQLKTQNMFGAK